KEVLKAREDDIKGKVQNWMSRDSEPRLERIATELLEEYNDVNLVAALLQELVESNDEVDVQLTFEKPLSRGKGRQGKGGPKRGGGKFDSRNRRPNKGGFNNKKKNDRSSDRNNKKSMKGRTFADHKK